MTARTGTGTGHRRRVAALLASAGLLLTAAPVVADSSRDDEEVALDLLAHAARASRSLTYSGTKYVAAWHATTASTALVDVRHDPRRGVVVNTAPAAGGSTGDSVVMATAALDPRLLGVLAEQYAIRVAGTGHCAGREASVVEARRTDGPRAVVGRFWVDRETGLLLRREVYDDAGRRLRSTAFVELTVAAPSTTPVTVRTSTQRSPRSPDVEVLRDAGWPVPATLPGGFALFAAQEKQDGDMLHVAYSDGLSTTSLFVQRGDVGARPSGFVQRPLGGEPVWVRDGSPERVVWPGADLVWTLVSDAPEPVVEQAVAVLPHDELPGTGLAARLARGLSRLRALLDPFS